MACFYPHRVYRPVCQKNNFWQRVQQTQNCWSTGRTVAANAVPKAESIIQERLLPRLKSGASGAKEIR